MEGTLSILESALKNKYVPHYHKTILGLIPFYTTKRTQIKRFVLLSSAAAITGDSDVGVIDETRWNAEAIADVNEHGRAATQANKYRASKTLSEKGKISSDASPLKKQS